MHSDVMEQVAIRRAIVLLVMLIIFIVLFINKISCLTMDYVHYKGQTYDEEYIKIKGTIASIELYEDNTIYRPYRVEVLGNVMLTSDKYFYITKETKFYLSQSYKGDNIYRMADITEIKTNDQIEVIVGRLNDVPVAMEIQVN